MTDTETKTAAVTAITVDAPAFTQMVADLAPFACADDTLPAICALHLVRVKDGLRAEATDRYVAGWDVLAGADADGKLDVLVNAKDAVQVAKTITAAIRPFKFQAEPAKVRISHAAGTSFVTFTLSGYPGPDIPLPAARVEGDFPKIARLTPSGEGALAVRFNAAKLAKLCKVTKTAGSGSRKADVIVRLDLFEGTGPAIGSVEGDGTFGALVMTVRSADGKGTGWSDPSRRWPEAGDKVRFEGAGANSIQVEYEVTDVDRESVGLANLGERYRLPRALATALRMTVVKPGDEPAAAEPEQDGPDTRPASAKYRMTLQRSGWAHRIPPVPDGVKEPTVDQLEADLRRAAYDEGSPRYATSCSSGCEVEPDGRCTHGHPTWLVRFGQI